MNEHYVPSLGLPKGARVRDYDSVIELDTAAGERGACLRMANKYLVEKGSLVDFRDRFAEALEETTGFKMKVKVTVKKKADGSEDKIEEPVETEVAYLARFRKAIADGEFTHERFPKDTLEDALQAFADSLGAFTADAKRPERVAKVKLPKWITERVNTIFTNNTTAKWWEIMARENIKIAPFTPGPENVEKNKLALALAIREREARREAEESKQYV